LGDICELVGLVVATELRDRAACDIANSGGRFDIGGTIVGIVAKLAHQRAFRPTPYPRGEYRWGHGKPSS
jgi:hypothetical protein